MPRNIQSASNHNLRIQIKTNWGQRYSLKLKSIRIEDLLNINELSIQLRLQKRKSTINSKKIEENNNDKNDNEYNER